MTDLELDFPKSDIGIQVHPAIRLSFQQAVSDCARLGSFATGTPPKTDGPVGRIQEELAIGDLSNLALHGRRLVHLTRTRRRFYNVYIPAYENRVTQPVRILKILNMIVHHEFIDIVRTSLDVALRAGQRNWIDVLAEHGDALPISPKVGIISDRKESVSFDLVALVELFQRDILIPIMRLCQEQDCVLGDDNFDEWY